MKKSITLLFLFVVVKISFSQHNNQYSQYMFNGLAINPAYAGANKALNITLLHRNQWTGFDGAPKTTSLSIHTPLPNNKLNVGVNFISDRYGVTNKNIVNGIFAYKLNFSKSSLSFGILGGLDITRNNWDQINTTTAGDAIFEGQSQKTVTPLAGVGIYYLAKKYFIGLSSPSLIQFGSYTKNTYNPMILNGGCILKYSESILFKPTVLVKYINNSPIEVDLNLNTYYKNFGLGFSYRTNDAVVFLLNYSINDQFNIGYAFDLTLSKLKTYNRGSHEVMLKYEFGYKVNATSPRYF
ncbi:MAG: type IX secretion system membrane protein PorP/SprF [Bacteroidetes bacterium]|nr:type IX secretion system membrane protein PorP/SprF [Bacteroidota bacterium]